MDSVSQVVVHALADSNEEQVVEGSNMEEIYSHAGGQKAKRKGTR